MDIRLIVLRSSDGKRLSEFYSLLGLSFDYHKHGPSPYHYGTTIGVTVFEIYPLAKGQVEIDKNLRLGFGIDDFDQTVALLREQNVSFMSEPAMTDFGYMAVIKDPDGRKIEIYKK